MTDVTDTTDTTGDTLEALLHRVRTGTTTADDAGKVDAMIRLAHDWGWRNGRTAVRDESQRDLLVYLNEGEGEQ